MKIFLILIIVSFASACNTKDASISMNEDFNSGSRKAGHNQNPVARGIASERSPVQKYIDPKTNTVCYYIYYPAVDTLSNGNLRETNYAYHGGHAAISCVRTK